MSHGVSVEDVGLRVCGGGDIDPVRRHLIEASGSSGVELIDRLEKDGKKDGDQFCVHFAWLKPAKLGRFTSPLDEVEILKELEISKFRTLTLSEMVRALGGISTQHVQELLRLTNHENRARCAGLQNGDRSKLAMAPLGSIARIGEKRLEHFVFFKKDFGNPGKPQLHKREAKFPLLWLFPVRPVVELKKPA